MSRFPTDDELQTALLWLRSNEGEEGGEREACEAVAAWLEAESLNRKIRNAAKSAGVPVKLARERLVERGILKQGA